MSDAMRNLASRYTLDNYPYLDNPNTQARWNQLGADLPTPEAEPEPEPAPEPSNEAPKPAPPPVMPAKPTWFEKNKPILAGIAAGLGLLAFLKSRE